MYKSTLPRPCVALLALLVLPAASFAQSAPQGLEMPLPGGAMSEEAPNSVLQEPAVMPGERLDPMTYGPSVIETMEQVMERERQNPSPRRNMKARNGAQGTWAVPSKRGSFYPHSGEHYLINKWGDTRMSIEFGAAVDFKSVWVTGHATEAMWADGLRLHGYVGEELVASTDWLEALSAEGELVSANFENVTSIQIEARAVYEGSGWYGLDDLSFSRSTEAGETEQVLIDFEDLSFNVPITGSGYAGLTWPQGTGSFSMPPTEIHPPQTPPGAVTPGLDASDMTSNVLLGGAGTAPTLTFSFQGPRLGDAGAGYLPPDTHGTVGPNHFVAVVNQNISIYNKATGTRLSSAGLQNFWGVSGSAGDPRAVYDHHADRWIIIATDFSQRLRLAYSLTDDPTGAWFKTSVTLSAGVDANRWPDYPTLGVDATGIYSASYMVGGNSMSIFAIDKAPLLAGTPSLGTVTAWRNLAWEGAIQPAVTHGNPGRMYLISRRSSTSLRLRYVTGSMSNPTLNNPGNVTVPSHSSAPDAPAMGSVAPLDGLDWRPQNAVFRNGSLWMTHGVRVSGRGAVRWYEIDPISLTTNQVGTVSDSVMHCIMPSIDVNANSDVLVGFSGSDASIFPSSYFAGRLSSDPSGQMSAPQLLKAGVAAYNQASSGGVNRWGDYSNTCVDPSDDLTFWTIQEHARTSNNWGTRIGKVEFPVSCITPQNYCTNSTNSTGNVGTISHTGQPSLGANNFELSAGGLPTNKPGLFFFAPNQGSTPLGNGTLCISGQITRLPVISSDAFGFAALTLDFNSPPFSSGSTQAIVGDTRYFQFWYRDPAAGGAGYNLTNGLTVTYCP